MEIPHLLPDTWVDECFVLLFHGHNWLGNDMGWIGMKNDSVEQVDINELYI